MKEKCKAIIPIIICVAVFIIMLLLIPLEKRNQLRDKYGKLAVNAETDERSAYILENVEQIPNDVLKLYYKDYEKWCDFVYDYPVHKNDYDTMTFTDEEINSETVPQLFMYDRRWAYEKLEDGFIAQFGCLPTCLTMAYLYLTHSPDVDPYIISKIAEDIDAVGINGIRDDRVKELAGIIGLEVTEYKYYTEMKDTKDITTDVEDLKGIIDRGNVAIGGMKGEVFGVHAVVFGGYTDEGFIINDPANKEYSEKIWQYEEFEPELFFLYEVSLKK